MQFSVKKAATAVAVGGALGLGTLFGGVAPAQAAEIGQVCNLASQADVYERLDGPGWSYHLDAGAGFRIEGFASSGGLDYYVGHGNGQATGLIYRFVINQSTCHF